MNGAKARMLRKKAQQGTVGLPDKVYQQRNIRRFTNGFETCTIELGHCTRGVYRALKANYRKARR